jgi:hypothetical protein
MPGYLLIEEKMLRPFRVQGFHPNPLRLGLLDYLRELRQEIFPFTGEQQIQVVGLEDVLLAADQAHALMEVSLTIRKTMASRANDLEANLGRVQVIFRRPLVRANDFWFDAGGGKRISLQPIFGSPQPYEDTSGICYQVGFNLT